MAGRKDTVGEELIQQESLQLYSKVSTTTLLLPVYSFRAGAPVWEIAGQSQVLSTKDGPFRPPTDMRQIRILKERNQDMEPILALMGLTKEETKLFHDIASYNVRTGGLYRVSYRKKKNGQGFRKISAPHKTLKTIQKKIYRVILSPIMLSDCCHGFRKRHSIMTNALPHVNKKHVINIDLKDFFPTIKDIDVYKLFTRLGFSLEDAWAFMLVTTLGGKLPQGAPTSPAIANLICRSLDNRVEEVVKGVNGSYTRYADDLTISGSKMVKAAIPAVKAIIKDEGFKINRKKFKPMKKTRRQEVTGLTVNSTLNVSRKTRRAFRAAVHNFRLGKDAYWNDKDKPLTEERIKGFLRYLETVKKANSTIKAVKLLVAK